MIKLHLGCGVRDFGSTWIHIDKGDYDHLDSYNITELPYTDHTVDLIYASHVLEYFDRDDAIVVLKEWKRVLKNGGVLRLAVPDLLNLILVYAEDTGVAALDNILGPLYGKMKMGKETIYHKTVYDYSSLCQILISLGFEKPRLWNWRETEHSKFDDCSQAYFPHMDKENGILISLNVEVTNVI